VLRGDPNSAAELIPADTVVNAAIVTAWYQATKKETRKKIEVFNLKTNAGRILTWGQLGR